MAEVVALIVVAVALIALFALTKRGREHRHRGARTVACRITTEGVERDLADGRHESIRFDQLIQIEVVCTPVPTADGARAFVLLAQSVGATPSGCLVPLGIGYDEMLLDRLVRLAGFEVRSWADALARPAPSRVTVWDRPGTETS